MEDIDKIKAENVSLKLEQWMRFAAEKANARYIEEVNQLKNKIKQMERDNENNRK